MAVSPSEVGNQNNIKYMKKLLQRRSNESKRDLKWENIKVKTISITNETSRILQFRFVQVDCIFVLCGF